MVHSISFHSYNPNTQTHTYFTSRFCKDAKWLYWPKSLMNWILNANNRMNYANSYKSTWALLFSNWLPAATRISNRNWLFVLCSMFVFRDIAIVIIVLFLSPSVCIVCVFVCKSARKQSEVMDSKIPSECIFGYVNLSNGLFLIDDVRPFDKWPKKTLRVKNHHETFNGRAHRLDKWRFAKNGFWMSIKTIKIDQ